jgi:hypothetical protein
MSNLKTLKPFKKGEDPRRNTKGRPKGTSDIRERFEEAVNKKVMFDGEEIDMSMAIMLRLISEARKGSYWAVKLFMKYSYGNPKSTCVRCERLEHEALEEKSSEKTLEQKKQAEEEARAWLAKWKDVDKKATEKKAQKLFEQWKKDYLDNQPT